MNQSPSPDPVPSLSAGERAAFWKREAERWEQAFEHIYCSTVIPRRSVDRIRRALAEGRDPEPYLQSMEDGLQNCVVLMEEMSDRGVS